MDKIDLAQDRDWLGEGSCEHGNEPVGPIKCREVSFRYKPAIATKSPIGVIIYQCITTCFGPYGPSSGEYNILPCLLTSPKRYRYLNDPLFISMSLIVQRQARVIYIGLYTNIFGNSPS
jgi:hypothetical protein